MWVLEKQVLHDTQMDFHGICRTCTTTTLHCMSGGDWIPDRTVRTYTSKATLMITLPPDYKQVFLIVSVLFCSVLYISYQTKKDDPSAAPVVTKVPTIEDSITAMMASPQYASEVDCLAMNAYYEARNQNVRGQMAVANVVMNRSEEVGKTACEVIHTGCQFSWVCSDVPRIPKDDKDYLKIKDRMKVFYVNRMVDAVIDTMNEESIPLSDVTHGATYYHADYVNPRWSHQFALTAKIGDQIFYKDN